MGSIENGVHQHWASKLEGAYKKRQLPLPASLERVQIDPWPYCTCPKIRQWISFTCVLRTFQPAASVLALRVHVSVHEPFKNRFLVSYSLWFSWTQIPLFFKARCCEAHLPGAGPKGWEAWCGAQTPCSLGRNSTLWYPSHLCVAMLGVWILTRLRICPSYLSQCSFFLSLVVE